MLRPGQAFSWAELSWASRQQTVEPPPSSSSSSSESPSVCSQSGSHSCTGDQWCLSVSSKGAFTPGLVRILSVPIQTRILRIFFWFYKIFISTRKVRLYPGNLDSDNVKYLNKLRHQMSRCSSHLEDKWTTPKVPWTTSCDVKLNIDFIPRVGYYIFCNIQHKTKVFTNNWLKIRIDNNNL